MLWGLCWGRLEHTEQQISPFLNDGSWLEMTTPDLAGSIGEAEVQMNTVWRNGAIQGDHFEITLQNRRFSLPRALEGCTGEVAHNAENESVEAIPPG